jgi:hypothetical protein
MNADVTTTPEGQERPTPGARQHWRPAESWPAYILGGVIGALIGGHGGLEGLLFGALLGGSLAVNLAQFFGILARYLLVRGAHAHLTREGEDLDEVVAVLRAIPIAKLLGLGAGALAAWGIAGPVIAWLILVGGLVVSTRWGMIASYIVRGVYSAALPTSSRSLMYLFHALDAAGALLGASVGVALALLLNNLVLMYLVVPTSAALGSLIGRAVGMLVGIAPPWALSDRRSWRLRRWASRRYPVSMRVAELVAQLQEMLVGLGSVDSTAALNDERTVESTPEQQNEGKDPAPEEVDFATQQGVSGGANAQTFSGAALAHAPLYTQASLPSLSSDVPAAGGESVEAAPAWRWRPAESNAGLALGLVIGLCAGGMNGMVVGGLVGGQLIPALRRLLTSQEPSLDEGVGASTRARVDAVKAGEIIALLLGALIGVASVTAAGHMDLWVSVAIGATWTYNICGAVGLELSRSHADVQIASGRRGLVAIYYTARTAAVLLALGIGLFISANLGGPLVMLLAGSLVALIGALLATVCCAVAGIVPPWKTVRVRHRRLRAWASRSIVSPHQFPTGDGMSAVR